MVSTPSRIQPGRRGPRALKRVVAIVLTCGLLTLLAGSVACAATRIANAQTTPQPALATTATSKPVEQAKLGNLEHKVDNLEKLVDLVFVPITVLIGVLSAGGIIGVVFSIRDQRRVSQLHELTVAGEVSSQRRSEQSYGSFLEQSQTTIALVNDTLLLAKEASDREARSATSKANDRIGVIEANAEQLMLQMFREEDFELLVENRDHRRELHRIGQQVRELETTFALESLSLPPYTTFIKAMDQFLLDDTESAIPALRRATQSGQVNDLYRFALYWLGYMLTTVGEYQEAGAKFRDDEIGLPADDAERLQLARMVAETEFFRRAKPSDASKGDQRSPRQRFQDIADVLDHLSLLAIEAQAIKHSHATVHTRQEIAQTRADLYAWIAYDPKHLDEPIPMDDHESTILPGLLIRPAADQLSEIEKQKVSGPAAQFAASGFANLNDGDEFRIWALQQAVAICEEEAEYAPPNFYVSFSLAECYFKLQHRDRAMQAFATAEEKLNAEWGDLIERRRVATLRESLLICHSRDLMFKYEDPEQRRKESRIVRQTYREASEAVEAMSQPSVTVFSQIQRRNISQEEFRKEIDAIVEQEKGQLEE
jgi:tetratricopeptide (TPR) repeat protein